jgi:hypothetical protein
VSRAAGLLAIAVLGIVMLNAFNRSLDRHLSSVELPAALRQSVEDQRIKLAAIALPEDAAPTQRRMVRQAVDQSFVNGFRRVMLIGAALALASGVASLVLIGSRTHSSRFRQI